MGDSLLSFAQQPPLLCLGSDVCRSPRKSRDSCGFSCFFPVIGHHRCSSPFSVHMFSLAPPRTAPHRITAVFFRGGLEYIEESDFYNFFSTFWCSAATRVSRPPKGTRAAHEGSCVRVSRRTTVRLQLYSRVRPLVCVFFRRAVVYAYRFNVRGRNTRPSTALRCFRKPRDTVDLELAIRVGICKT